MLLLTTFILPSCGNNGDPGITDADRAYMDFIRISHEPNKISYYVGDQIEMDGLEVVAYYQSQKHEVIDYHLCDFTGASTAEKGDKLVTVTYRERSASFTIFVDERPTGKTLQTVDVDVLPNKTTYKVGDALDLNGLVVNAKYSDGSVSDVTGQATYKWVNNTTIQDLDGITDATGVKTIRVTYEGKFDTFTILVKEAVGYDDSQFGDNTDGRAMKALTDAVRSNHNYQIDTLSYLTLHPTEKYRNRWINLDNKALYNYVQTEEGIEYNQGIIYQKDQGFVGFYQNLPGGVIVPKIFYSTSLVHMASEIYDLVLENVIDAMWVQDGTNTKEFTTTGMYAIATGCNFTGYAQSANLSAPEKLIMEYVDDHTFVVTVNFTVHYYDSDTSAYVDEPGITTLTVSVGTVVNEQASAYIANPSYVYTAPTEWDYIQTKYFNDTFDGIVAPFPAGASYAFDFDEDWDYRGTYLYVLDYACGDIREAYRALLQADGYEIQGGNPDKWRKTTTEGLLFKHHNVTLTYHAPTESYNNKTYGWYYPEGEFYIEYLVTESSNVSTVERYNKAVQDYIGDPSILPEVPFGSEVTKVTNFDFTDDKESYVFRQGKATRFYIADYNVAKNDLARYYDLLVSYGFDDDIVHNPVLKVDNLFKGTSFVSIMHIDDYGVTEYPGYIEIRCQLYASDFK